MGVKGELSQGEDDEDGDDDGDDDSVDEDFMENHVNLAFI